jgi:hypothetical protein
MKKTLLTILVIALSIASYGQSYTLSAYYSSSKSIGAELIKHKKGNVYGIGISTFLLNGAEGADYTEFINPGTAYEVVNAKHGSSYAILGIEKNRFYFASKVGFGVRKNYYNGETNGMLWYVIRDGGTYLLCGAHWDIESKNNAIHCMGQYQCSILRNRNQLQRKIN